MTQDDIIAFVIGLPGVVAVTASEASGAPEISWGDSFFFYDPDGDAATDRRMPFATIVTKDYDGFDTASNLNRPGVFRLNIAVGRTAFEELIGHPPRAHAARSARFDYTALDQLVPHPAYATQAWVAILNPGETTAALACSMLTDAHALAVQRHRRRT
ncbi:erythromycin esterase [Actinomadura alba]|uniref:Erythromycin esterase n=2 Tax=Actinomadura alba TaxID=406431 RepID=A0ABR7M1W6_9ACTN|nr:erythromycin esterase [Actinomadura alba]